MSHNQISFKNINGAVISPPSFDKHVDSIQNKNTTIMLRNVPKSIVVDDLVYEIKLFDLLKYIDFLYLPIDFKSSDDENVVKNVGYAFINFKTSEAVALFTAIFSQYNLKDLCPRRKCLEVSTARIQGFLPNIKHFLSLPIRKDYTPKVFDEFGSEVDFSVLLSLKDLLLSSTDVLQRSHPTVGTTSPKSSTLSSTIESVATTTTDDLVMDTCSKSSNNSIGFKNMSPNRNNGLSRDVTRRSSRFLWVDSVEVRLAVDYSSILKILDRFILLKFCMT